MQVKNQIVIISAILALLATATIAASNIVQPANARCTRTGETTFGNCISSEAGPSFGPGVSSFAHQNNAQGEHGVANDPNFGREPGCGFNNPPNAPDRCP